jgi:hypothetical protein
MKGLHVVGDILTKISANCVINLHVALLFMCLFLWVFLVYTACTCLLLFQYGFVCLQMYCMFIFYI